MKNLFRRFGAFCLVTTLWMGGPALWGKTSDWDSPSLWTVETDPTSSLLVKPVDGIDGLRLDLHYTFIGGGTHWAQIKRPWDALPADEGRPLTFVFRAKGLATMEVKLTDEDGSTFICRFPLKRYGNKWEAAVLYKDSFEYAWGGNHTLDRVRQLAIAIAGTADAGILSIDEIGLGRKGQPATLTPDGPRLAPDRFKSGVGFRSRRAHKLRPEHPGVLAWLKAVQDNGSVEQQLLPSMEDNRAQTFNNALAAMAFILKDERERAERILDFYANAMDENNPDPLRQDFYVKRQARGFYQDVRLRDAADGPAFFADRTGDRWMGDNAWLLMAYVYYSRRYDQLKYDAITQQLTKLLVSFYTPSGNGGYIRHGWRRGDTALHENGGHSEGNLDAYAALRLMGRADLAGNINRWLDGVLFGSRLPLDLYSWRVLSLGEKYADALTIPENDLRFRKVVRFNGRRVMGFFHGPDPESNNLWVDGLGHMACAYFAAGDETRGNFYANQLDALLIQRVINEQKTYALPYTTNAAGGYNWVRSDQGFVSTAAWYIFAKNKFNPFTLRVAR